MVPSSVTIIEISRPTFSHFPNSLFHITCISNSRMTRGVNSMRQYIPDLMTVTTTCLLATLLSISTGCSFFPEALQPNQLQKLNRGAGYSDDPFFSIPDSEATARQAALKNAFRPELNADERPDNAMLNQTEAK